MSPPFYSEMLFPYQRSYDVKHNLKTITAVWAPDRQTGGRLSGHAHIPAESQWQPSLFYASGLKALIAKQGLMLEYTFRNSIGQCLCMFCT